MTAFTILKITVLSAIALLSGVVLLTILPTAIAVVSTTIIALLAVLAAIDIAINL